MTKNKNNSLTVPLVHLVKFKPFALKTTQCACAGVLRYPEVPA